MAATARVCQDEAEGRTRDAGEDCCGRENYGRFGKSSFTQDSLRESEPLVFGDPKADHRMFLQYKCRQIMTRTDFLEGAFCPNIVGVAC